MPTTLALKPDTHNLLSTLCRSGATAFMTEENSYPLRIDGLVPTVNDGPSFFWFFEGTYALHVAPYSSPVSNTGTVSKALLIATAFVLRRSGQHQVFVLLLQHTSTQHWNRILLLQLSYHQHWNQVRALVVAIISPEHLLTMSGHSS